MVEGCWTICIHVPALWHERFVSILANRGRGIIFPSSYGLRYWHNPDFSSVCQICCFCTAHGHDFTCWSSPLWRSVGKANNVSVFIRYGWPNVDGSFGDWESIKIFNSVPVETKVGLSFTFHTEFVWTHWSREFDVILVSKPSDFPTAALYSFGVATKIRAVLDPIITRWISLPWVVIFPPTFFTLATHVKMRFQFRCKCVPIFVHSPISVLFYTPVRLVIYFRRRWSMQYLHSNILNKKRFG